MLVSAIVAIAKNNVIGINNGIPWYLPADLKYFKKTTMGHHIIMGRKSFESIGRPLPNRINVIVTRDPFFIASNCLVVHAVEEALQLALDNNETEAFIIGGGEIYKLAMPYVERLYLTEVDLEVEGAVYFPEIDFSEWNLISAEAHKADEKNKMDYVFKVWERMSL
jgi:dihydrofolate reductase